MNIDDLQETGETTGGGQKIYTDNAGHYYIVGVAGSISEYHPFEANYIGCAVILMVIVAVFWVAAYLGLILAIVFFVIASIYSGFQILGGGLYVPCKLFELQNLLHFQDYSWGPRGILLIWHDHCAVMQAICLMQHERLAKKLQAVQAKGQKQLFCPVLRRLPLICGAFIGCWLSMAFWFLMAPFIFLFKATEGKGISKSPTPYALQNIPYQTPEEIVSFYNQERGFGKTMSVHRYYLGTAIMAFLMGNLGLTWLCYAPLFVCGVYSCRCFTRNMKINDGHLGRGMMLTAYILIYPTIVGILSFTPIKILSLPLLCLPIVCLFLSLYARPANIFTKITVFIVYAFILLVIGFAIFNLRLEVPDNLSLEPQLQQAIKQLSNFVHSIWK